KVNYQITTHCCSSSEGIDDVVSEKIIVFDKSLGIVIEYDFTETTHKTDSTTDRYSLNFGYDPNAEFTRFTKASDDGVSGPTIQILLTGVIVYTFFRRKDFNG
ncbi:MAG: hypothetical protein ACW99A_17020, partial [Candidatus Kariarchaeaceae archaeon]